MIRAALQLLPRRAALPGLAAIGLGLLAATWLAPVARHGDALNYYMMAESLARDGDLVFAPEDLARVRDRPLGDPYSGLFLHHAPGGMRYGKPVLLPLVALPFFAVLGGRGFILLNLLLFGGAVTLGFAHLRRGCPGRRALAYSLGFFGLSSVPLYALWIHPEMLSLFLLAAALFLALAPRPRAPLAGLLLGLLATMKIAAAVFLVVCLHRTWRERRPTGATWWTLVAFLTPLVLASAYQLASTGDLIPYAGDRTYYRRLSDLPFFLGADDPGRSDEEMTLEDIASPPRLDPRMATILLATGGWYLAGRFTGVLLYFPFSLGALWPLRQRVPARRALLGATLLYAALHIVFWYQNYHGGGHVLGNRYFLLAYPALLFATDAAVWNRTRTAMLAWSLVVCGPLLAAPAYHSLNPYTHTLLPPYRWFPVERSLLAQLPLLERAPGAPPALPVARAPAHRERHGWDLPDRRYFLVDTDGGCPQRRTPLFVLTGDAGCELLLRGPARPPALAFRVGNDGRRPRRLRIEVNHQRRQLTLGAGERAEVRFAPGEVDDWRATWGLAAGRVDAISLRSLPAPAPDAPPLPATGEGDGAGEEARVWIGWPRPVAPGSPP